MAAPPPGPRRSRRLDLVRPAIEGCEEFDRIYRFQAATARILRSLETLLRLRKAGPLLTPPQEPDETNPIVGQVGNLRGGCEPPPHYLPPDTLPPNEQPDETNPIPIRGPATPAPRPRYRYYNGIRVPINS